ncbi:hypothetical protein [Bosea sp. TND4EK4]|uniref:hypothetical protein n=1 Tax=Bosea sp. TND4EK4 TaxID=1907408 RepID=UPI000953C8F3|nr:hypothetical protein [Bosea sp. TND4EK4]SIQ30552.1 hypothetical protein SAMN05880592_102343 [Bosea sp. TND4EK4]
MTTRRHFLGLAAAGAALALLPAALAPALARPARAVARPVTIIFAPSVAEAWGRNLGLVRSELESTLASILGSRFAGSGHRLVVSVNSLWLSGNGGNGGRVRDGGGAADIMESVATLYDASGRAVGSWPIRSTEFADGMARGLPNLDQLRLEALARNNAWWIKRYVEA